MQSSFGKIAKKREVIFVLGYAFNLLLNTAFKIILIIVNTKYLRRYFG